MHSDKPSAFLIGIGGAGMRALASVLVSRGWRVSGSDRAHDVIRNTPAIRLLIDQGVKLYPQDGSGIEPSLDQVIISTAIEETVADLSKARKLDLPILHRSEALASCASHYETQIAIAGTSGKSSVTAMLGWVMNEVGNVENTVIVNGAGMNNFGGESTYIPQSAQNIVLEVDESDGSFLNFSPDYSIVTNISLDHKELSELETMFRQFIKKTDKQIVINSKIANLCEGFNDEIVTFGWEDDADFQISSFVANPDFSSDFKIGHKDRTIKCHLPHPGRYNAENAAAVLAMAVSLNLNPEEAAKALSRFQGTERRFHQIGEERGIKVIDDFAHNPDKVAAVLDGVVKTHKGRVLCVFQPHGYKPTVFLKDAFIDSFVSCLRPEDMVIMPEIYYVGGTAERIISAADLISGIQKGGHKNALFIPNRADIPALLVDEAREGDLILTLGARDPTLAAFADEIYRALSLGRAANVLIV